MKKWIVIAGVTGVLAMALTVVAAPHGFGRGDGPPEGRGTRDRGPGPGLMQVLQNPEFAEDVGITDDQVAELEAIMYAHRQEMIKLHGEQQLAELEVDRLLSVDEPDLEAVTAAIKKQGRTETQVKITQVRHELAVKKILGEDVLDNIRSVLKDRRQEHRSQRMARGRKSGHDRQGRGSDGRRGSRRDGSRNRPNPPPTMNQIPEEVPEG